MSSRRLLAHRAAEMVLLAASCIGATSCFTTVVKSGAPAAPPAIQHDEKWHSGLIYGLAELSGPYDLSRICPGGWAEIKTETSFVNGFVQAVTFSLYNPQTVTIRCAAGAPPPNVSGIAPPGSPMGPASPPALSPPTPPPSGPPPVAPTPAH